MLCCFNPELTCEVPTDHIRDDAVRPHSLRSGCGRSPPPTETLSVCGSLTPDALSGAVNCAKGVWLSISLYLNTPNSHKNNSKVSKLMIFDTWVCVAGLDGGRCTIIAEGSEHAEVIFIKGDISQKGSWGEKMNTRIHWFSHLSSKHISQISYYFFNSE